MCGQQSDRYGAEPGSPYIATHAWYYATYWNQEQEGVEYVCLRLQVATFGGREREMVGQERMTERRSHACGRSETILVGERKARGGRRQRYSRTRVWFSPTPPEAESGSCDIWTPAHLQPCFDAAFWWVSHSNVLILACQVRRPFSPSALRYHLRLLVDVAICDGCVCFFFKLKTLIGIYRESTQKCSV